MKTPLATMFISLLVACGSAPPPKPEPEPAVNAREAHELALKSFDAGRYREAIGGFERAGQLFLSIDDQRGVAVAAISKAEVELLLGETGAASETLRLARDAIARNGDKRLYDRARLIDARVRMDSDTASAREQLNALARAERPVSTQAQLLLCELAVSEEQTACASNLPADDVLGNARVEQLRARAAMAENDAARAAIHLDRALNIYRVLAYRPGIAAAHESYASVAEQEGDDDAAIRHLERALYLRLWIRDRVHAMENLARLIDLADSTEERADYERWRSVLRDEESPEWEALILEIFSSR